MWKKCGVTKILECFFDWSEIIFVEYIKDYIWNSLKIYIIFLYGIEKNEWWYWLWDI